MTAYCEICGEELDPDDENGTCQKCKDAQKVEGFKENADDFIDPGIT